MRIRRELAFAASIVVLLIASVTAQASAALPVRYSLPAAQVAYLLHPDGSPPGSNDWACRPSAAHPRPVVLVHGTLATPSLNWNALSPLLKNNGYCVYAASYGRIHPSIPLGGLGRFADSAAELSAFVDRVLEATGASQVDMVGHSQGGVLPRYYMKFNGGAAKVHTFAALAPANHGTTVSGLEGLLRFIPGAGALRNLICPGCEDLVGSTDALARLNAGGDTLPGVSYTVISSAYDGIVTPYTSQFLSGPNVTNILVQRQCILDGAEHVALAFDHIALRDVLNALDPGHARRPLCYPVLPFVGG